MDELVKIMVGHKPEHTTFINWELNTDEYTTMVTLLKKTIGMYSP